MVCKFRFRVSDWNFLSIFHTEGEQSLLALCPISALYAADKAAWMCRWRTDPVRWVDLLLDSTGIKFLGKGESKCKKHGTEPRRQWRKLHMGIDVQCCKYGLCVSTSTTSDIQRWFRNCWQIESTSFSQIAVSLTELRLSNSTGDRPSAGGSCGMGTSEVEESLT